MTENDINHSLRGGDLTDSLIYMLTQLYEKVQSLEAETLENRHRIGLLENQLCELEKRL